MVTVGKIKAEYEQTPDELKPKEILIDVIGVGGGVVDRLKEQYVPARGINVGESPSSKERFARLRDELWFEGRDWFLNRACTIPKDDELMAELTTPLYSFTSSGKVVVEPKKDITKRGLRSPDLADAFLLTFAGGLKRKVDRSAHRRWDHQQQPSAWAR
jgi:phage terminase large subunit